MENNNLNEMLGIPYPCGKRMEDGTPVIGVFSPATPPQYGPVRFLIGTSIPYVPDDPPEPPTDGGTPVGGNVIPFRSRTKAVSKPQVGVGTTMTPMRRAA